MLSAPRAWPAWLTARLSTGSGQKHLTTGGGDTQSCQQSVQLILLLARLIPQSQPSRLPCCPPQSFICDLLNKKNQVMDIDLTMTLHFGRVNPKETTDGHQRQ